MDKLKAWFRSPDFWVEASVLILWAIVFTLDVTVLIKACMRRGH